MARALPQVTMASFMNKQQNVVNISNLFVQYTNTQTDPDMCIWGSPTYVRVLSFSQCVCMCVRVWECVRVIKLNTELPSVGQKHSLATFTAPVATSIPADEFFPFSAFFVSSIRQVKLSVFAFLYTPGLRGCYRFWGIIKCIICRCFF